LHAMLPAASLFFFFFFSFLVDAQELFQPVLRVRAIGSNTA
jgi:hypothetical protein